MASVAIKTLAQVCVEERYCFLQPLALSCEVFQAFTQAMLCIAGVLYATSYPSPPDPPVKGWAISER